MVDKDFNDKLEKAILAELGLKEVDRKHEALTDPKNKKTMSRLSAPQIEFVGDAFVATEYYPELEPLKQLADEVMEVNISHKGQGREEFVKFQQATKPGQGLPQIGIFGTETEKNREKQQKKRRWFRRGTEE